MAAQRKRFAPADRARVLAEWEANGLTAKQFARQLGVSMYTLYTWRRAARAEAGTTSVGPFAEVVVRRATEQESATDAGMRGAPIEIEVGDAVVRVGSAFDDGDLQRVLTAVRATA